MTLPSSLNWPPPVFKMGVRETVLMGKALVWGERGVILNGSDEELEEFSDLGKRIADFLVEIDYTGEDVS